MDTKDARPHLMIYSDSPVATTGLGRVTRYMIRMFQDRYRITVVGLNHPNFLVKGTKAQSIYDRDKYDITLITPHDVGLGSSDGFAIETMKVVLAKLMKDVDILITNHDWWNISKLAESILQSQAMNSFKWVAYTSMDHHYYSKEEAKQLFMPDRVVYYSKHGMTETLRHEPGLKDKVSYVWNPLDIEEFPKVSESQIKKFVPNFFGRYDRDKHFGIGMVGRNMFRKNPSAAVKAVATLQTEVPNAFLYAHMKQENNSYNVAHSVIQYGANQDNIELPPIDLETRGVKQEVLNKVYRSMHVILSTSMGEGFGYSTVEALACEIPFVGPNNTSFPELLQDYGYLADCPEDVVIYGETNIPRHVVDTEHIAALLLHVHDNYEEAKEKAASGRKWVSEALSLKTIGKEWENEFKKLG